MANREYQLTRELALREIAEARKAERVPQLEVVARLVQRLQGVRKISRGSHLEKRSDSAIGQGRHLRIVIQVQPISLSTQGPACQWTGRRLHAPVDIKSHAAELDEAVLLEPCVLRRIGHLSERFADGLVGVFDAPHAR